MELGDTSDEEASPPQPNGFDAPNAADRERHEKGSFHHCCRMFWHGSLNSSLLMEQGGAHVHIWPYYFSGISFPQKTSRRCPMYPSEFIWEGIKNIPLRKQWTQRKLSMSLGYQRQWCIIGLLIRLYEFIPIL